MLLVIENVLNASLLAEIRAQLDAASWHDGRETAGYIAARQKSNEQLRVHDKIAIGLGQKILDALSANPQFVSFALPRKILSPMFNRYQGGAQYGFHIDNAMRVDPVSGQRIRTDLSTTIFLNDPDEYEGGELIIRETYGTERVKLPAGHAVVYPGSSLHRVSPVTRGMRLGSFFWTQSMVSDNEQRALLYQLDGNIQQLAAKPGNSEEVTALSGIYHNLIRQWAQS